MLQHNDNIDWADFMDEWRSDPENKKISRAGDDRTPAWRWIGCCYTDGQAIALPAGNIMRSIMEGGAMVPVPGGKGGKTFKAQTQSGMMSVEPFWEFRCNGQRIPWQEIEAMRNRPRFADNREAAKPMRRKKGFEP
jgi:hypothetical protein